MATQTTYYNFNKPAGTDLVNPLVDTNPNWDIADATLHEFNERSIANCTEVVSLGVHAISRLDTTAKFLKWIATANFTAGDTFVVDGTAVAAATPAGAALATDAYIAGAVVLACLNADNTAMTIFVSGTNVATDSARLGGELPSYYATDSDMTAAETDITNIQSLQGNTSIVGIGDGTLTGAISSLNSDLANLIDLIERGGLMPNYDYSNPLHTFSTGNLTFTATEECFLVGSSYPDGNGNFTVSINNKPIAKSDRGTSYIESENIEYKLLAGDVVTVSGAMSALHVLKLR